MAQQPMTTLNFTSRTKVYNRYGANFAQAKDTRTMDGICTAPDDNFQLQAQQKFLKRYVTDNPGWRSLMLYHEIGSGKTCSAITIAQEYIRLNPAAHVTVVLPARLKTNMIDELLSPCADYRYMTHPETSEYLNADTTRTRKAELRKVAEARIQAKYDIMSIEKFVSGARNATNLRTWATAFTRNRLIIFDEVHNLLSTGYRSEVYERMLRSDRFEKGMKGTNTCVFKYVVAKADPTAKLVFMTATPIFDHISQFKELTAMLKPEYAPAIMDKKKIMETVEFLRGKVSYFPGTSPKAYPTSDYVSERIVMTQTQDAVIHKLNEDQTVGDDLPEAFMIKQRQASIACLPHNRSVSMNMRTVLGNLAEYSPKIVQLIASIEANTIGKHLVYSSFIGAGTRIVEGALRQRGWVSLKEVLDTPSLAASKQYKVYTTWDGEVKDQDKTIIKSVVNSLGNMDGIRVRVILGSPSIKEGVSFKHVQHIHMLDPVWNSSAKSQVEGRAIRFCSHVDIPQNHPTLRRNVTIHEYMLVPRPSGLVDETADMMIYNVIIPNKRRVVQKAEDFLKRISIDYHLFRRLHEADNWNGAINRTNINALDPHGRSAVRLSQGGNITLLREKPGAAMEANSCPTLRRPQGIAKMCPRDYPYLRRNAKNHDCCYKKPEAGAQAQAVAEVVTGCPVARRPVNGVCPAGQNIKINKYGARCCYKR